MAPVPYMYEANKMFTTYVTVLIFFVISVFCNEADHRINNGNSVTIEQHPYLASIRYYDNHICTGVIVNDENILTSIQCVAGNGLDPSKFTIRVGASKHFDGQEIAIRTILVNPEGSNSLESKENDIAIIKLATKLIFSDNINKIDLHARNKIPDNTIAQVIGWGVINNGDDQVSDVLRKTDETLISYLDCNYIYGINMIGHSMICAKNNSKSICRGDIGGPLVLNNELIGIASWNYACNENYYPDVFASTVFLRDWIVANI